MMLLIGLTTAFAFGIGSLWIKSYWPTAIFQTMILSMASVLFARSAWRGGLRWRGCLFIPFGIVGLCAIQLLTGTSEYAWSTRVALIEWLTHACAAMLAFQVFQDPHRRRLGLRLFTAAAGVLAVLAAVSNYAAPGKALGWFDTSYPDLVFGPFLYHNKAAEFAELAFPVAIWLAVTERAGRAIFFLSATALAGLIFASGSRAGIAILLLETIALGTICLRRRTGFGKAAAIALPIAVSAGALVFGWNRAVQRAAIDMTSDLRLPILTASLDMARQYWITGSGVGTWNVVYPEFARFDTHAFINQAHCDWLQWLIEGGAVLPLAIFLMVYATLRSAVAEWWTLGIVFVWLHGLVDYPVHQAAAFATLQFAFWGGTIACQQELHRPAPPKEVSRDIATD